MSRTSLGKPSISKESKYSLPKHTYTLPLSYRPELPDLLPVLDLMKEHCYSEPLQNAVLQIYINSQTLIYEGSTTIGLRQRQFFDLVETMIELQQREEFETKQEMLDWLWLSVQEKTMRSIDYDGLNGNLKLKPVDSLLIELFRENKTLQKQNGQLLEMMDKMEEALCGR